MNKSGPLSCAPQFTTKNIKKGVDVVLPFFEGNCERRNSLARTFRIELTRDTTRVETPEQDKRTLQQLIANHKARILEILISSTCLKETEEPRKTAEAIYDEIARKFTSV